MKYSVMAVFGSAAFISAAAFRIVLIFCMVNTSITSVAVSASLAADPARGLSDRE